ncbi:MAG: urease accessory protein UreE [Rhizobiaceae bacterium]
MLTAKTVLPHSHDPVDTITLDETARHRRRIKLTSDKGIEFLLDLPQARLLQHGEGLKLNDGRIIEVRAEPEKLYEITANNSRHLLALSWQIGNRHLAAQITEDKLYIRSDPVIKQMLLGLGAMVKDVVAPFSPEAGAYDDHKKPGHSHD